MEAVIYLEDQDKFRMSGIFRDVYLLKRPEKAVQDYRITTEITEACAKITLDISYYQETPVTVSVEDAAGNVVAQTEISKAGTVTLEIANPAINLAIRNIRIYTRLSCKMRMRQSRMQSLCAR